MTLPDDRLGRGHVEGRGRRAWMRMVLGVACTVRPRLSVTVRPTRSSHEWRTSVSRPSEHPLPGGSFRRRSSRARP